VAPVHTNKTVQAAERHDVPRRSRWFPEVGLAQGVVVSAYQMTFQCCLEVLNSKKIFF
jgi:hypothetical protein